MGGVAGEQAAQSPEWEVELSGGFVHAAHVPWLHVTGQGSKVLNTAQSSWGGGGGCSCWPTSQPSLWHMHPWHPWAPSYITTTTLHPPPPPSPPHLWWQRLHDGRPLLGYCCCQGARASQGS